MGIYGVDKTYWVIGDILGCLDVNWADWGYKGYIVWIGDISRIY